MGISRAMGEELRAERRAVLMLMTHGDCQDLLLVHQPV